MFMLIYVYLFDRVSLEQYWTHFCTSYMTVWHGLPMCANCSSQRRTVSYTTVWYALTDFWSGGTNEGPEGHTFELKGSTFKAAHHITK